MAETAKKDVKAKATSVAGKAELVIGAGAKALTKAINEAKKVLASIEAASQLSESLTDDIATKQSELEILDIQYTEKERQLKLNIALSVQEQKGVAIDTWLAEFGMEAVETASFTKMKADKINLETNFIAEVEKVEKDVKASEQASYRSQLALEKAQVKGDHAELVAKLATTSSQVTFYEREVQALRQQLADERDARVKEAQARGNSQVIVNNGK